ncbi:DNA polymerase III subunit epsilon [Uliginosibacterium sp. sgz301328]|uniref:DNA polymerase III subunit epsilon n=1 Tax=Uliginosibacterium sp. sgz301328 TaxID=3243764 RepID=UPI00359D39A7
MRQIVLDTETTGLDWRTGDRVVEIGCVELLNRKLTGNNYHVYLNPQREVGDSERIHGLSDDFLSDKPLFEHISRELADYLADAQLIIHNAAFDVGFLNMEFDRLTLPRIADMCHPDVIDTVRMAKEMFPGKKASLDALCSRYEIDNSHRTLHGALLDAELLAEVYLAMTRGQESLTIGLDEDMDELAVASFAVAGERPALVVLRASEEELAAHMGYLNDIDKATKGGCLWLPHEASA